jgi:hypothetical protein
MPQDQQKYPEWEDRKFQGIHLQKHLHADQTCLCILNESSDTQDGANVDKIWIRRDEIPAK